MAYDNSMAMDFLFQPEVQSVFDTFSALLDIRIAFFAPDGTEIRCGTPRREHCDYCRLLRTRLGLDSRCRETDRVRRDEARRTRALVAYRCHAGMTEAILPLYRERRLIGFVMIGQFRTHDRLPPVLRKAWRNAEGDDELQRAFAAAPEIKASRVPHVLALFETLARYINRSEMIAARGGSVLEPALAYMRDHLGESITLVDMARELNRSPGTISNLFRARLGTSFKQTLIDLKLGRAEELLASTPGLTVQEAAARVGYADALYFSRLFRKHRGRPPSACKADGAGR